MQKKILIAGLVIALIVIGWMSDLLWDSGQFKTITPHFDGQCNQIGGAVGPEDITIHPLSGVAFISACDRRAVAAGKPGRGGIYAYDVNSNSPSLVHLTPGAGEDFQPHGISLYVDPDGNDALFVINHEGRRHTIEIYDLVYGELAHRTQLSDPLLVSPNDLVAVGPNRFYVSNDHRHVSGWKRMAEEYLRLRLANVVYYDGARFLEVASGVAYANGINISPDGKLLYLSATVERALHIFDRNPITGSLSHREKLKLNTGLDNIEVDEQGRLWIGAHPKLLSFVRHSKDPTKRSPSQVLRVTPKSEGGVAIVEVYLNAGAELSASSAAAARGNRLLIGSVFDPRFLDCQH